MGPSEEKTESDGMEHELRHNLRRCAELYAAAAGLSVATLGRLAAGDWRFFGRLGRSTFTARKYDEVIGWFSQHWPGGAPWPDGIARPQASSSSQTSSSVTQESSSASPSSRSRAPPPARD